MVLNDIIEQAAADGTHGRPSNEQGNNLSSLFCTQSIRTTVSVSSHFNLSICKL